MGEGFCNQNSCTSMIFQSSPRRSRPRTRTSTAHCNRSHVQSWSISSRIWITILSLISQQTHGPAPGEYHINQHNTYISYHTILLLTHTRYRTYKFGFSLATYKPYIIYSRGVGGLVLLYYNYTYAERARTYKHIAIYITTHTCCDRPTKRGLMNNVFFVISSQKRVVVCDRYSYNVCKLIRDNLIRKQIIIKYQIDKPLLC